ncbi:MAG: D-alanyl-D-alanine carboxypeptidase, partial [Candidatus Nanopelagicales bacterium]
MEYRKRRIPAVTLAVACAGAVVVAGSFASPGFAADNDGPPMPQPGDTAAVLSPLASSADQQPTQSGVQQALAGALSNAGLGPNVRVAVYDTDTGDLVYEQASSTPATPASTNKILTAAAVLDAYGPDHRIKTTVVAGAAPNEVVLVGAGDPALTTKRAGVGISATASLAALADQTAES